MAKHPVWLGWAIVALVCVDVGLRIGPAWQLNQQSLENVTSVLGGQIHLASQPPQLEPLCPGPACRAERRSYQAGIAFQRLGQDTLALEAFHRARELDPNNRMAFLREGQILDKLGRTDEAWAVWQQGQVAAYYGTLGEAALQQANWKQAEAYFRQSIRIDPLYRFSYVRLGATYRMQKAWEQARVTYERALAVAPDDLDINYHLGVVWLELGDLDKARVYGQKVVDLYPAYAWGYILVGNTCRLRRAYEEAATWYLYALDKERSVALTYLGVNAMDQRDEVTAIRYFDEAIQASFPAPRGDLHFYLGQAYLRKNQHDLALRELTTATQLEPSYPEFHLALADLYRTLKQTDDAIREYQQVLKLEPENLRAAKGIEQIRTSRQ